MGDLTTTNNSTVIAVGRVFSPSQFLASEPMSAFGNHVSQIVPLSAQEQMIGIDARRVVASMTDNQALWNRTIGKFPRNSMSTNLGSCSARSNIPVTSIPFSSHPLPAILGTSLLHLVPESFGQATNHSHAQDYTGGDSPSAT